MEIDLTKLALFENFVEIKVEDLYIDLHNCFDCHSVRYSNNELMLSFVANPYSNNAVKEVWVVFKECVVEVCNMDFAEGTNSHQTIDLMYRGRFLHNGGLIEAKQDSKGYYYVNFESGSLVEVSARKVIAIINVVDEIKSSIL